MVLAWSHNLATSLINALIEEGSCNFFAHYLSLSALVYKIPGTRDDPCLIKHQGVCASLLYCNFHPVITRASTVYALFLKIVWSLGQLVCVHAITIVGIKGTDAYSCPSNLDSNPGQPVDKCKGSLCAVPNFKVFKSNHFRFRNKISRSPSDKSSWRSDRSRFSARPNRRRRRSLSGGSRSGGPRTGCRRPTRPTRGPRRRRRPGRSWYPVWQPA